jgi:hypothetical protein
MGDKSIWYEVERPVAGNIVKFMKFWVIRNRFSMRKN